MNINTLIKQEKKEFDIFFKKFLKSILSKDELPKAMFYGSMNGGKRIRPFIVKVFSKIAGIKKEKYMRLSAAIECIHSYSLIHDDLPSMDNDDYRRGKLSVHKKFGEAGAILAGDSLHDLAFEIISHKKTKMKVDTRIELINKLSNLLGFKGLAGGQSLDLLFEKKKININKILNMYEMKTAALFSFACASPLILNNKSKNQIKFAEEYGCLFGLVFQIVDDIIDETGNFKKLGKTPGKDKKQFKCTIISSIGKKRAVEFCKIKINKFLNKYKKNFKQHNQLEDILLYNLKRLN
jgi:geranylgeranyl pyrophosphate synthase